MIVLRQHRIYRIDIKANPRALYIFGDNLDRKGMGGQAAEMRGEPNSFGIATKRSISHSYPDDYFFDSQKDAFEIIDEEFSRLFKEIREKEYKAVVLPADGIGTGLSKLPELAPNLLKHIGYWITILEQLR